MGHAVLCARAAVGNEPFAVILADDLIDAPQGAIAQMAEVYRQTGNSVLGVESSQDLRQHLSEMGFVPGAEIEVVSRVNGDVLVSVKGATFGVGREMAMRVVTA